ncbi:MAG: diguanylate cyclase [Propionivibrio sp.]
MLDNVESLIYLKDTEGRYLFANKRVLELYGTTADQLIGQGDERFFGAETVALLRRNDQQVLRDGRLVRTEESILTLRTDQPATYYSVKVPLFDDDGAIYALCGISTDITEIKRVAASLLEEQQFSRLLLDSLPGIFYLYSYPDLRLQRWNKQHETLLGFTPAEMQGRHIAEWFYPDAEETLLASARTVMETGAHSIEAPLLAKDGRSVHFLLTSVKFETPEQTWLMGIGIDTSWRKLAEEQLQLAASVFAHAREGIIITDLDGRIIDVNEAFTRITGYAREEALGRNPRFLNSGLQDRAFYAGLWRNLIEDGHWNGEIWNRRKNGDLYAEMQNISTVLDAQGRPSQYVALFSDITTIKEHEKRLEHIAHYDVLTTLPNRTLLADRMHQAMAHAQRRDALLAVAYLDLDGFKAINDRHGHETGDLLLLALAGRMKDALREGDTIARLGGDEFVVVLLDLADAAASLPMINRLLTAAAQPIAVGDLLLQVSASLGVTFYPQSDEVDADQLLRQADQAMYQAKLAGKNRYHLFDADQDRSVRGLNETLQEIRRGLGAGEFVMHFQPKVNMRSGEVIGVEALVRWQHPGKGLLPPLEFLPLIEDHPLAVELGEWVINAVLKHREDWRQAGLDLPVSINIGARQLQQANFVERLQEILAAHPSVHAGRHRDGSARNERAEGSGTGVAHHRRLPRDRRRVLARRLRHRLLVADLPQAPVGHAAQDRPELRAQHARRPGGSGDPRRCPRPGDRLPAQGDRRGRGNRRARRDAVATGLRDGAGLRHCAPDAGHRDPGLGRRLAPLRRVERSADHSPRGLAAALRPHRAARLAGRRRGLSDRRAYRIAAARIAAQQRMLMVARRGTGALPRPARLQGRRNAMPTDPRSGRATLRPARGG